MSTTATPGGDSATLTDKQRRILDHLQSKVDDQTYFKSRLIGEALDMSAKEVGTNMTALQEAEAGLDIEKWGYSSSTTWMVTN